MTNIEPQDFSNSENFHLFDSAALVPDGWHQEAMQNIAAAISTQVAGEKGTVTAPELPTEIRFRIFNPTLIETENGYSMCYRVVADNTDVRRLATCRLSYALEVIPGSVTPLSSLIEFFDPEPLNDRAKAWHADPRYLRLGGKIYLIWNDGANRPINHQFIMQMDEYGLQPAAPAREITRNLMRDPIEKNWMLFESEDSVWATYSIQPHEILRVDLDSEPVIHCSSAFTEKWRNAYSDFYGELRGSAQPVYLNGSFLVLAHSSYKTSEGRKYCATFYRHEAIAPFRIISASISPFELPNPKGSVFEMEKLNKDVGEVIYPCGFVIQGENAIISYGINDEACAVVRISLAAIEKELQPTRSEAIVRSEVLVKSEMDKEPALEIANMPKPKMPVFWWDAAGKKFDGPFGNRVFEVGNFGDIASMEAVERICGVHVRAPRKNERKLICIGSVLHTAKNGDVVWGTGAKGSALALGDDVKELSVHAVRGPLTADFLRRNNINISNIKAFFDPGCLITRLYSKEISEFLQNPSARRGGVRIIPHYHDDLNWRRRYPKHLRDFVSVDASPATMIGKIIGADRVISSSLHGIIFAEALGIPALWLAPSEKEDQMKYYDYYYGTGRHLVKRYDTLEAALVGDPMPLPVFDLDTYINSFPHDEVSSLQVFGLTPGETYKFSNIESEALEEILGAVNFERIDVAGMWLTSRRGLIRTQIQKATKDTAYRLSMYITPFNPKELGQPQKLTVRVNGGTATTVEWSMASRAPLILDIRVEGGENSVPLDIEFETRHARSPRTLGISPIGHPLGVCISSIGVHPES